MGAMNEKQAIVAHGTRVIRLPKVLWLTGLTRDIVKRLVKRGEFPVPVKLFGNRIGWYRIEVDEWCRNRPRKHHVPREAGATKQARVWPRGIPMSVQK